MASLAGTKIDKYDMIEEVGHGGMAVVYRGLDRVLKREVAVKVLHPHLADREESRLRLEREAIAVAKLRHENILEIFDYSGPEAEASYIVTEFIHGVTLKDWVDDRLDPRPAVAALIVHRLCLALQHAHRTGIVHRDIKPENVMIREDGVLKLMDFGIAQIIDNQKLTLTGQLIGSPAYMAPELISGRPLDQRTDLFSLGILLYQLATGRLPFFGRNPHEVLNRIADGEYPPAANICPLVDRDLEDIIALSLASDPDERFQTVEAFGRELAGYLDEVGIEPSNEELGSYFRAPETYVVDLDQRVCKTLTERAREATAQGHTARAIRLLARVLEFDAAHPGATELLARLRKRERRNRRMMMVGVALFMLGLVWTLAQLMPSGESPPQGERTSPTQASLDAAEPAGGTVAAAVEGSSGGTAGSEDTEPSPAESSDDDTGTGDTGETTAAEVAVAQGTGPSSDRIKRRPPTTLPPRVPVKTPCTLQLEGIPLPTARNLTLKVGLVPQRIKNLETNVEFEGPQTVIRVTDKRYTASHRITREECEAGPVSVTIRPLDARVTFVGADSKVVVVCKSGCRSDVLNTNQSLRGFQAVPLPEGKLRAHVELVLKHSDYEPLTLERDLLPGPNTIQVAMVPR